MKKSQLLELIKNVVREEQDYQQLFKHMLDKVGKSITDMSDDEKKKFFNAVDTAYKAKSEGKLRGYNEAELTAGQKKIDTDGDGEIEGSDLAALRAGKKVEEENPGLWANIRAKKARGEEPAHGNSDAHKDAVKAGKEINKNEAGTPIDFKWPKGNTSKEIEELEAEYKKLIEKGSDILEKQKQLIRKEPLTGEYPWENYDKWPTKLKIEVEKLEREFEKNNAKTTEMGKKLFKLKGFSR